MSSDLALKLNNVRVELSLDVSHLVLLGYLPLVEFVLQVLVLAILGPLEGYHLGLRRVELSPQGVLFVEEVVYFFKSLVVLHVEVLVNSLKLSFQHLDLGCLSANELFQPHVVVLQGIERLTQLSQLLDLYLEGVLVEFYLLDLLVFDLVLVEILDESLDLGSLEEDNELEMIAHVHLPVAREFGDQGFFDVVGVSWVDHVPEDILLVAE